MVLDFLINGLDYPVIPCIQDRTITCNISECFYKKNGKIATRFYGGKLRIIRVLYHTCVSVKKKDEAYRVTEDKKTIWISENTDDLGTLMIKFFDHYSIKTNFSLVSIKETRDSNRIFKDSDIPKIHDPFFAPNNVA